MKRRVLLDTNLLIAELDTAGTTSAEQRTAKLYRQYADYLAKTT